jgi:hypothetical protein
VNRAAARRFLGVDSRAEPADVLAAYDRTSRRLKQRIVDARTVTERNRAVRALRNLRALRDIALDPADIDELRRAEAASRPVLVDDWWQPDDGVPTAVSDRASALRWLGLGPGADRKTVRGILLARGRLLKQRIAQARSEASLRQWQGKLADFRRISAFALPKPFPPSDPEDTATESSTWR